MKRVKNNFHHITFIVFLVILLIPFYFKDRLVNQDLKVKPLNYLSFNDLLKLTNSNKIGNNLYSKLQKQLNTPYVVNRRFSNSLNLEKEKKYIRAVHWNVERGFNIDQIKKIFLSKDQYYGANVGNVDISERKNLYRELDIISKADVILLNEVDIGMPRTEYKNIASELANEINYNYAFATEFIELGPIYSKQSLDKKKYLGLHGNAILSKYPILNAKIIRLPDYYNWYEEEKKRRSSVEGIRRIGAKKIFRENITSELRRGGRNALIVEIQLPNKKTATFVSTHLEDRCFPKGRFSQMKTLLTSIQNIRNPVVIGGDLNTTTSDSIPTSFKKEVLKRIKDPNFLARQAIFLTIPVLPPGVGNLSAAAISTTLKYKDPIALSIPVISPNSERKLFNYLKDFQFYDGGHFDFGGDSKRSSNGKRGLLANSNERQLKGFESTFEFEKPNVIGYFKLDWFFIKPANGQCYPFYGRTLKLINKAYPGRISDHNPITVDLAL